MIDELIISLQGAAGASPGIANEFPSETWLLAPTPNMGLFEVTDEQLEKLKEVSRDGL